MSGNSSSSDEPGISARSPRSSPPERLLVRPLRDGGPSRAQSLSSRALGSGAELEMLSHPAETLDGAGALARGRCGLLPSIPGLAARFLVTATMLSFRSARGELANGSTSSLLRSRIFSAWRGELAKGSSLLIELRLFEDTGARGELVVWIGSNALLHLFRPAVGCSTAGRPTLAFSAADVDLWMPLLRP